MTGRESTEPLDPARLSIIRERVTRTSSTLAQVFRGQSKELRTTERDRAALLAEVDRLSEALAESQAEATYKGQLYAQARRDRDAERARVQRVEALTTHWKETVGDVAVALRIAGRSVQLALTGDTEGDTHG